MDLSDFLHAANNPSLIAKKFDHWGSWIKHPKGGEYKYYAERDDFSIERSAHPVRDTEPRLSIGDWWKEIELSGGTLFVSAPLRYKIGVRPLRRGLIQRHCVARGTTGRNKARSMEALRLG
ncbi:MAG: hypothetical protein HC794_06595 [Nitrospiraceae bacterium]|nr:hypothetical protein [Nitrospiraceae bacterium]